MKSSGCSFGPIGLARSCLLTSLIVALGTACGGDDTEVVPMGTAGAGAAGRAGADGGRSDADAGGKAGGSTGTGGVGGGGAGGTAGAAGKGGAGTAGAGVGGGAGRGGAAGSGGTAGSGGVAGAGGSAGTTDGGGGDGGNDGSAGSSGADGGPDASPDGDAGSPPVTIDHFHHAIAVAWCDRLAECCMLDASRFDRDNCLSVVESGAGPERVAAYLFRFRQVDAGIPSSVAFDPGTAAQCINLERTRDCTSEDGPARRNLYATCTTALQGSVLQNGACTHSIECRSGQYCNSNASGGTGTCVPVIGSGGTCDDPNFNSDRCAYLGIHNATSLYCAAAVGDAARTCVSGQVNGSACTSDRQCTSGVCSTINGLCVNSQPFPSPATCAFYTKSPPPDAQGQ